MKKGVTWLEWILAMGIMVAITTLVIIAGTRETKTVTESTVQYVSGKSDCREILLSAVVDCSSRELQITNRGRLKIRKVIVTLDDASQIDSEKEGKPALNLPGTGDESIVLNIQQPFSNVTILPVIDVGNELFGCQEKALTERC